jgi:hypothetical protein
MVAIGSWLFLGETISSQRRIGIFLVALGVFFVGRSGRARGGETPMLSDFSIENLPPRRYSAGPKPIHQLRSQRRLDSVQRKEDSRSASCDKRGSDTD